MPKKHAQYIAKSGMVVAIFATILFGKTFFLEATRAQDDEQIGERSKVAHVRIDNPKTGPYQLLVKLKENAVVDEQVAEEIIGKHALVQRLKRELGNVKEKEAVNQRQRHHQTLPNLENIFSVQVSPDELLAEVLTNLQNDPNVEFAQLNFTYEPDVAPNDPQYFLQYAHPKTQAPAAWDLTTGTSSIAVAVIGTGVKWDHPDLAANIWINSDEIDGNQIDDDNNGYTDDVRGWNFESNSNNPMDIDGHDTSVAGVVAGVPNNGVGIAGVCWECKVMALKISYTTPDVANAIYYAVNNGVKVINMSFGNYDVLKYGPDTIVQTAIDYAISNEVMVIATAGNESISTKRFPGAADNVIGVASTDSADARSAFSNWGDWVDIAAPGTGIISTALNGGYTSVNGTSFAAPYVAGVAGLMFSRSPGLSLADARAILEYSVDTLTPDRPIGSGRINTFQAVSATTTPQIFSVIKNMWDNFALPNVGAQEIWGTALGDSYVVDFQPAGGGVWTQIGNGNQTVNGTLASWDVTNISEGSYTLRLTSTKQGASPRVDTVIVSMDRSLQAGFPKALDGGSIVSPATIFDLDGDGDKEIIVGSNSGKVFVLNHDGSTYPGWPKTGGSNVFGAPAIGDIDGDGQVDIVATSFGDASGGGKVYAWHINGTSVAGWPKFTGIIRGSALLANLDADPALEVVAAAGTSAVNPIAYVWAWKGNGSTLPGWPYALDETNVQTSPAYGDVNGDSQDDIVVASWNKVVILNKNGSLLSTWNKGSASNSHPILFNNDTDYNLEIGQAEGNIFTVRDYLGVVKWSAPINANSYGQAAVGDLDNANFPEVLMGLKDSFSTAYAWNSLGGALAGWPKNLSNGIETPTIGDVDGDGFADIVFSSESGQVFAYNRNGTLLPGFPKATGSVLDRGVTITDLDGDGDTELIVGAENGTLYVWSVEGTTYNAAIQPWPMARHDAWNTGNLHFVISTSTFPGPGGDVSPPFAGLTSPQNGQTVTGTVSIIVPAGDNVGVTRVELYKNGVLTGTLPGSPMPLFTYTFNWDTTASLEGPYTLQSKAYDAAGNVGVSPIVNVTVDRTAPTTSISAPSNGQVLSGLVSIQATASDSNSVLKVELYRNGGLVDTQTVAPYAFSWDSSSFAEGAYTLQTKAYDPAGNVGNSTVVNVTVDRTGPTVSLIAPVDGATVSGTIAISATANDANGVVRVEFYRDGGTLLGNDTTAPYSVNLDTLPLVPGAHTIYVKAFDVINNATTSTSRTITVRDQQAPITSITFPTNGSTVNRNSTVSITANAADNIAVTRVEFYVNGILKCTDTTAAYSCNWNVPNGKNIQYILQSKAYDAATNVANSTTATVTSR